MYCLYLVTSKFGRTRYLVTLNNRVVSVGRSHEHFKRVIDSSLKQFISAYDTKEQWLARHEDAIVDVQFMETSFQSKDILKTIQTMNLLGE
ncbi:hypothetical protein VPNG_00074 [Vibrio phage VBP47]|uniref:Uncharacterized protein n=1 Tax=Vibrio phage VBP47 TaxID=754073 RepID=M4SM58_9CAUD|nr:hypothetical protein VPNG_00074 [Vibrio phage VBP47]AGH57098.1 hypothetical protein VPNG_00074 [Vibrio phage VBP47]